MDELLHHCLRELAFEGDFGSNVSRLRDFILDFYAQTGTSSHTQNPDDAFCSFVWSLVVQQPTVLIGLIPPGLTSEVWIAPQTSAKRKAKVLGVEHIETSPSKLDPIIDPKSTPLELLRQAYGERLRIAAEPESIFSAITGTHIRSSKMSPMVYSALQIITRGRDTGVTVVELGRQSGYDQKTCFYLVRQLTELDLVVKVRRGGVGTHFCIHKYFFSRNLSWKAIRDEEIEAETSKLSKLMGEPDLVEDEEVQGSQPLTFTPIDARHLSSLPLVSARVVRLLKASKNHIHASNNMLITLGFSNPTKTDRRFFQSRIREMIQQRIIEKVIVPNNRKKVPNTAVKCFRLVEDVPAPLLDSAVVIPDLEDDVEDNDPVQYGVKMNITIHKQIINLLEGSGTRGMTLNELSQSLCHFDKRTIELLLARADKFHPPSHLSDLSIAGLMETSGRERRHRYYTVANYYKLVSEEALDNSTAYFTDTDLVNIGRFYAIRSDSFYENYEELVHHQDAAKDSELIRGPELEGKTSVSNILSKRGRPRKPSIKGKKPDGNQGSSSAKRKRKTSFLARDESETSGSDEPLIKRRRLDSTDLYVGTKQGKPAKDKDKVSNQLEMASREKRGRSSLRTEAQNLLVPSSIPQSDIGSNLDGLCNVRASTRRNDLGQDIVERSLMSISITDPTRQEFPQQKQHRPIIPNRGPVPSAVLEEKGPAEEQRIDDPMLPLSLYSETSTQNVSPARSTISFPAGSVTLALPQDPAPTEIHIEGYKPMITQMSTNTQHDEHDEPPADTVQLLSLGSRVNVSHLRRENELLRLVESLGGIVNIQTKEFFEGHMRLLKSLAQSGEPTSAPVGTRIDKRTAVASLNSLEKKGRLKQLKTSIMSHIGVSRPACIVYLPDIEQKKLNSFLTDLAHGSQATVPHIDSFVKINEPVEYGASNLTSTARAAPPLQLLQVEHSVNNGKERWGKNLSRANQLFTYDDATIRDVFLSERTTVGQLYGFIMGKALRCRELHLATLKMFGTRSSSPHIVSVEKRIVDFSFFCHDITLGLHCSIVSSLSHDEELTNFLATEEGRNTLVRDLPSTLHSLLQIGRSRSRSRFLDLLDVLRSLNLVTPLQPSNSHTPFITCLPNGEHPTAFEQLIQDKPSAEGPVAVPNYWYFPESAPVHIWAASDTHPPFWKHATIATYVDGLTYWKDLHEACTNLPSDISVQPLHQTPAPTANITIARSLRRTFSWKADYYFTWHQIQYLKQFVKASSTTTPPHVGDAQAEYDQVQKLCHVTSAPREAVKSYLSTARDNLSKVQRKSKSRQGVRGRKRNQEAKALLAKKAEEVRKHREEEWQTLLQKNHPDTLTDGAAVRIERIRNRFLQAGSIKDLKWEKEIQAALREADLASTKMPKLAKRTTPNIGELPSAPIGVQTTLVAPPEISIQTLIALQGPIKTSTKEKPKRKRKRDESNADEDLKEPRKPLRRHRFQWNPDFDELAKDASAIIRARCRGLPRLDWAAFEQVFPAVPRNTVRQRLSTIRETPANEAYLRRLEDNWYDLWMKHKGTPHLPDDDDRSPSNFDLITHLEFLRSNVDKNALRVGFAQATEATNLSIPADIEQLQDSFNILDAERAAPDWDFMWNALIEEGREKKLKQMPLSRCPEQLPCSMTSENDKILIAEAALKMAMGTPPESYDSEQASWLLRSKGEDVINTATRNLLSRGILSKSQRDPTKQAPGRQLKISEINQSAIGGSISPDTFQDASSLMDVIESSDAAWHEWPLTATDGDCAALLQLVSENKVEFKVDTSLPRAARAALDWNSKKADDDQIETTITVCYHHISEIQEIIVDDFPTSLPTTFHISPDNSTSPATDIEDDDHGVTVEGNPACCRRLVLLGLVDCAACLNEAWSVFTQHLSPEEKDDAQWVIDTVHQAGAAGVRKSQLMASSTFSRLKTLLTVNQMVEASIPQVYWAGYESLVLVSAHFIAKWSVIVAKDPISNLFPRRWLDIKGNKVPCFWQAALRAVMGSVIFRPGISQAEIRWRLRSVYDRQEVTELLWFLQAEGYLQYRMEPTSRCELSVPFDEEEEGCVYWFDMDKHWYQV